MCVYISLCVDACNTVSVAFKHRPWWEISHWWISTPVTPSKWPTGRKLLQTGSQPLPFLKGTLSWMLLSLIKSEKGTAEESVWHCFVFFIHSNPQGQGRFSMKLYFMISLVWININTVRITRLLSDLDTPKPQTFLYQYLQTNTTIILQFLLIHTPCSLK